MWKTQALDELHMDPRLRFSHGNNPASKNVRLPLASTNCNQIRLANKHPLNACDVDSSSRLHNSHAGLLVRCLRALLPLIIRLSWTVNQRKVLILSGPFHVPPNQCPNRLWRTLVVHWKIMSIISRFHVENPTRGIKPIDFVTISHVGRRVRRLAKAINTCIGRRWANSSHHHWLSWTISATLALTNTSGISAIV